MPDPTDSRPNRHRDAIFEHWRGEILREGANRTLLDRAVQRALHSREARADPILAQQIRAFAAERAAALNTKSPTSAAPPRRTRRNNVSAHDSDEAARTALHRLDRQFHEYQSHFFEQEADDIVQRIASMRLHHPDVVTEEILAEYHRRLERLRESRARFSARIDQIASDAVLALETGDPDRAARRYRTLSTIHAAHPQLLADDHFAAIRARMESAHEHQDHREAARELIQRERAIADELKKLAAVVHHFHKVARRHPHDAADYASAKAAYERAVREVQAHDTEWLAGMILELVDVLAEWDDTPIKAQEQVDHFIESVRKALSHLRHEIRDISKETQPERDNS